MVDQPDGEEIGTVKIEETGENIFEEFSAEVKISDTKNLFSVISGDVTIDTWEFNDWMIWIGSEGS